MDLATALAHRDQHVRKPASTFLAYVTAATTTTVTVQLEDGGTAVVPKLRSYEPVIGDVALILKSGGNLYALGALNAEPSTVPPPDPDDDPPPVVEAVRSRTFRPLFTGTYRGGWRGDTNALYQGDWTGRGRNFGAAYYGSGPSSLSGTAVSATLRYKRLSGGVFGSEAPTLRLLEHRNRPGGFPAFSRSFRGAGVTIGQFTTVKLPLSWVAALLAGTAGGIGIGVSADSPYIQLAGRSAWAPAMELTIRWRP